MLVRHVLRHEAGFGGLRGGAKTVEVEEVGGGHNPHDRAIGGALKANNLRPALCGP